MARASGVSLSLRRAGFPVTSPAEFDALDAVDRLYNPHVRVGHTGPYSMGPAAVWVVGGDDARARELLDRMREHLERKYPPTPVLGARNGQTRPRVKVYRNMSGRQSIYVG